MVIFVDETGLIALPPNILVSISKVSGGLPLSHLLAESGYKLVTEGGDNLVASFGTPSQSEPVYTGYTNSAGAVSFFPISGGQYSATFYGANAPSSEQTFNGPAISGQDITVIVSGYQSPRLTSNQTPAIGLDQIGFTQRILANIPRRWFSDAARTDTGDRSTTGLLYAVAFGIASGFGYVCDLEIPYTKNQTRWKTRSDNNLDLCAFDVFGSEMLRQQNELDPSYSLRIRKRIVQRSQTLNAILTAAVNYYLAAEAITANKVLQDFGLGTIGGLGTRGGLAVYQPSSEQTLVPAVYVFDTQSDPVNAAAFGITYGQVAILLEWLNDESAWFLDFAHLSRESYLGHQPQTFDSSKFSANAPAPDPYLDIVVRRVKAGGVRPVYIVKSN